MKRNSKRLPALLLAILLCLSLLPATAWAANFPSKFYASISLSSSSQSFGTVSGNGTYTKTGTTENRVIYGMEYAGGVFFTVEGNFGRTTSQNGSTIMSDDGWRELRMYNSTLTSYRTIGTVNQANGAYWIVDTAMDLSGAEPALYGTYQSAGFVEGAYAIDCPYICKIDLTSGKTSNWMQVTGLESEENDIIYAIAFDKDGTLYAIGADKAAEGGEASLYTIDLDDVQPGVLQGSQTVPAHKIAAITSQTGNPISTNFAQDMAFDYATDTLYWAENKGNDLYTLNTGSAVATYFGQVKYNNNAYALQSFCIANDTAFDNDSKYMVSVICAGGGTVTNTNEVDDEGKTFYMVESGGSLTLALTPDQNGKLLSVKVDGQSVSVDNLTEYTFESVTANHVIEVTFRDNLPVTQKNMTWFHYQGKPAKFYTKEITNKFYDLPDRFAPDFGAPKDGYTQTLLDKNGQEISNDTVILAGNYDVRVTHPGNEKYNALNVVYKDALQLGKCPGTPGRPVVYGKVGCTQGDLTTISALQDYYGSDGNLIDAAHDEIPVTLEWLNPETTYNEAGNYYASATIHAADELDQRLLDCYNLDDGTTPLTPGCLISSRSTQVVVLPADQASLIKVQTSDASGGAVSGKGVYKNGETVTVTAAVNENAGYEFKGWQEGEDIVSTNATYTFNAGGDRTLTALFEVNEDYRVTLQADPQNGGTVTGGGSYEEVAGNKATVEATANQGYYFIGWYNGETQASTENPYTFTVEVDGITLTAKFDIDYLARAEQAQKNFASAVSTDAFEWQTLLQAVDAYEAADDFVHNNPPSVIENADARFKALTDYYSGVTELDFSDLGLDNEDLAELYLFTGVTDLNLSGNYGVTSLDNLAHMTKLEALNLSNTVITDLTGLSAPAELKTLDLSNNTAISDLSGLSALKNLETLVLSGNKGVTGLTALKDLTQLETLDISNTGVTAFDTLVNENGKIALSSLTTLTAQNLTLTSISALAKFISEDSYLYMYVESWDFTGSTLPDTEENQADIETIQGKIIMGEFIPPTLWSPPTGGGGVSTYAVTVEDAEHGKVTASPGYAGQGSTVTVTVTPEDGYTLSKLTVTDANGNEVKLTDNGSGKFTFQMPAAGVTVEAVFTEILPEPLPFIDVDEGAWYADAVRYVYEHDLMAGYGGDLFGPNDELSRAQFCQIIYNMEDQPTVTGSSAFTDVADGAWYANAVTWAAENGIVGGYGGGLFGPEDNITREQFAAILYHYAQAKGYGTTASFDLSAYGDVSDVSAWAISAMQWACGKDIINGTSPTTLAPQGTATRAQAATMLQRFCEQYSQNEG